MGVEHLLHEEEVIVWLLLVGQIPRHKIQFSLGKNSTQQKTQKGENINKKLFNYG